ncbi:hypothetical protein PP175_29605 (plasmid) [Aneurinibacillus sp. Ricciae_BoGa-3]|uniref:hypothetical protein n=1 Tax=Aneurinibacillus sp. Ricciae_BoGa-3 TaxID=3022697 RepID=UPI002341745D|nr:hypothetical protein [Aneurinibacillus sp. Ricciae_BoGa-3]WCK57349.1 hypothetical protein PP175_29605 [Aneurinibacillus sp. Ricciae_BoGa-3]
MINQILRAYSSQAQYKVDDRVLRNYNEVCPCCQKRFKQINGQIKDVGAIILYQNKEIHTTPHVVIPYAMCKECIQGFEKAITKKEIRVYEEKAKSYIVDKLPDLKTEFEWQD